VITGHLVPPIEIDPARLLDPERWEGDPHLLEVVEGPTAPRAGACPPERGADLARFSNCARIVPARPA
jgi:hypothetical protein